MLDIVLDLLLLCPQVLSISLPSVLLLVVLYNQALVLDS